MAMEPPMCAMRNFTEKRLQSYRGGNSNQLFIQFSSFNSGTRENSLVLSLTSIASSAKSMGSYKKIICPYGCSLLFKVGTNTAIFPACGLRPVQHSSIFKVAWRKSWNAAWFSFCLVESSTPYQSSARTILEIVTSPTWICSSLFFTPKGHCMMIAIQILVSKKYLMQRVPVFLVSTYWYNLKNYRWTVLAKQNTLPMISVWDWG